MSLKNVLLTGSAVVVWFWSVPLVPLAQQNTELIRLVKLYEHGNPEPSGAHESVPSWKRAAGTASVSWMRGRVILRSGGREADAVALWQSAAVDNARRLSMVGLSDWNQGRRRTAVDYARLAFLVTPTNSQYAGALSSWLVATVGVNEAAREIDALLNDHPDNAALLAGRGYLSFRQGSADDARRYLERAESLAPEDLAVLSYHATFLIESHGPEDQLESLMRLGDMKYGGFHLDLARLYITQKRYQDASAYLTKILAERGRDPYAREIVGGYYFGTGRYREALDQYEAARQMAPSEPRFFINVGQAQMALGNRAAAVDAYCAAVPLDATGNARALLQAAGASCSSH